MPGFTPGRRWQPAFYPFQRTSPGNRVLETLERAVKGPLFGCRMCGNCLLQETAFICPMECPKGVRNGPCGGSTPEHCYVDETRPCIWYQIYDRSFRMGRQEMLLEVLPPLDWDKVGTETWGDVCARCARSAQRRSSSGLSCRSPQVRAHEPGIPSFEPVRQPDWWQGDSEVSRADIHRAGVGAGAPPEGRRVRGHSRSGAADRPASWTSCARTST